MGRHASFRTWHDYYTPWTHSSHGHLHRIYTRSRQQTSLHSWGMKDDPWITLSLLKSCWRLPREEESLFLERGVNESFQCSSAWPQPCTYGHPWLDLLGQQRWRHEIRRKRYWGVLRGVERKWVPDCILLYTWVKLSTNKINKKTLWLCLNIEIPFLLSLPK